MLHKTIGNKCSLEHYLHTNENTCTCLIFYTYTFLKTQLSFIDEIFFSIIFSLNF